MNNWEILLKFLVAILVSGAIGWERERAGRPAGFRTHILVGFSACLVMLSGSFLALGTSVDPTRMAAQVVSGIGFLGAGTIIHEGPTIKGLTTAATLWTVGCIGIASGAGFYLGALFAGFIAILLLTFFEKIEKKIGNKSLQKIGVKLKYSLDDSINSKIQSTAKKFNFQIQNISINSIDREHFIIEFNLVSSPRIPKVTDFHLLTNSFLQISSIENITLKEET